MKSVEGRQMFYVYILRSLKDHNHYAGYSSDLKHRLEEHNLGKVEATKRRTPLELIYYEAYKCRSDATTREKYFKTQWGRSYLKKVLKHFYEGGG